MKDNITIPKTASWVEWRMVAALTAISMLALLDKYALSLLIGPLKVDLNLSDTQVGIAVGAAFAVANIAIGIPAGWAADRFSRRAIVFAGVVLWSVMAAACGLAGTFLTFFLARAGVGLGEGIIPPACYSLIRDGVAPERQGRAFGLFAMANTLGPGTAILLGGAMIAAIVALNWSVLPLIGPVKPWQLTLILMGIGGLPLALLAYAFPEPVRQAASEGPGSYREAVAFMSQDRGLYLPLVIFSCCAAMVANALGVWFPAFVGRTWSLTPQLVGPTLGLILVICGPLGLAVAGTSIDMMRKRGRAGAGIVAVVVSVMLAIFSTSVPLAPSLSMMWSLEAGVVLCSTCYLAIVSTIVSQTAPPAMVGKIMATLLVLQGCSVLASHPFWSAFLPTRCSTGRRRSAMHSRPIRQSSR